MDTLTLTIFTMVCMVCTYFWGRYETRVSVEQISEAMIDSLVKDGYIKLDENDNLVKVENEMVDSSNTVVKNS
tara:strand:+ start:315 stop:533 length:219 start_codon:yes stop_codon:yes gene_type:complete